MRSGRTPIALAAVVVGGLAALAAWAYLGRVEDRAFEGARLVGVFVVKDAIREGTPGDQLIAGGHIGADRVPAKFRPNGAITNLDSIRGKVAATSLVAGQILDQGYFTETTSGSEFAREIPEGQVAISVNVEPVRGVANLVRPGDRVNILVVTGEGTRTLFQNVHVVAVGQRAATASGASPAEGDTGSNDSGLVTFAVPLPAAQKIAFAASNPPGSLYLTLVPPDNAAVAVPPLATAGLFQGSPDPYT